MEEAIQASKVHLLSTDHEDGGQHVWPVPFDPSLKEVTISLSGPAPGIKVQDPAGRSPGEGNGQGVIHLLCSPPGLVLTLGLGGFSLCPGCEICVMGSALWSALREGAPGWLQGPRHGEGLGLPVPEVHSLLQERSWRKAKV